MRPSERSAGGARHLGGMTGHDRPVEHADGVNVTHSSRQKGAGQSRSQSMVFAGYFLSRLTEASSPPTVLGVKHWYEAYELFRPSCGEGREETQFARSLKNTRDAFDSHLGTGRVGWRDEAGGPSRLTSVEGHVLHAWAARSDEDLVEAIEELLTRPTSTSPAVAPAGAPRMANLTEGTVLINSEHSGPGGDISMKSPRRAGRDKRIGDLAEALVRNHLLEQLGPAAATLIHHAAVGETPGYDISYVLNGITHCVEVKGTVSRAMASFVITRNEWSAAVEHGANYFLYLVSGVEGQQPRLQIVPHPAGIDAHLIREPLAWQVHAHLH